MNKQLRRPSPRSRVEELKSLRSIHKRLRPTTVKAPRTRAAALTSTLTSILSNSENFTNTSLVVTKPSVPLTLLNKQFPFKSLRLKRVNKATSYNSTWHSNTNSTKRAQRVSRKPQLTAQQQFEQCKLPLSAYEVLQCFSEHLTHHEQSEVPEYSALYYLGLKVPKEESTSGFDDEKSDYRLYKHEHLAFRYEILQLLGSGSFGQVCQCLDHKTQDLVAVKIIKSHRRFERQAKIETQILSSLHEDNTNIVQMKESFQFRRHTCIVFELLSVNLYDLLRKGQFSGFSLTLIRRVALQLLVALSHIKKQRIVHCDLKPENILLKQENKSGIKLIDFGSACYEQEQLYTYIQSRFYRAPEVILGMPYTPAIDMWSFGCILAEFYTGNALMQGKDEAEQLRLIMQLRGKPPRYLVDSSTRKAKFFHSDGSTLQELSEGPGLREAIGATDESFIDLIVKCLEWDPRKRITPEVALGHPWVSSGLSKKRMKHTRVS